MATDRVSPLRKRRWSAMTLRKLEGSIFIAPWILGFLIFMAFPLGFSIYMSFSNVRILASGIDVKPVGLQHYDYILFKNPVLLYNQLIPFLKQQLFIIPIIVIFALLIAILLNQKFYGRAFFRVIFFLPVIFSSGQIVREFIAQGKGELDGGGDPDTAGSFNSFIDMSSFVNSVFPPSWAGPIQTVLNSFVIILWYSGVQILIFLAGRQTISKSAYEAARIDGANPWEVFWKITLPGMTPFILLNTIYTIVDLFTFPTNPILSQMDTANIGRSSALAWIYFVIIFLFLGLFYVIFSRATRSQRALRG